MMTVQRTRRHTTRDKTNIIVFAANNMIVEVCLRADGCARKRMSHNP